MVEGSWLESGAGHADVLPGCGGRDVGHDSPRSIPKGHARGGLQSRSSGGHIFFSMLLEIGCRYWEWQRLPDFLGTSRTRQVTSSTWFTAKVDRVTLAKYAGTLIFLKPGRDPA